MHEFCSLNRTAEPRRLAEGSSVLHAIEPCPNTATRWTPEEVTRGGVTTREMVMPVCDSCNEMHYPSHSVSIGEDFDWDTDPRVLRYDADEVIARALSAIDQMNDHDRRRAVRHPCAALPTLDETFAAVERSEPATVMDVLRELGAGWPQRGTIRNRLEALVDDGRIVSDEQRPERFAVNHLETTPRG